MLSCKIWPVIHAREKEHYWPRAPMMARQEYGVGTVRSHYLVCVGVRAVCVLSFALNSV